MVTISVSYVDERGLYDMMSVRTGRSLMLRSHDCIYRTSRGSKTTAWVEPDFIRTRQLKVAWLLGTKLVDGFFLDASGDPSATSSSSGRGVTMEQRAGILVDIPPSNPTVSYWQDPPDLYLPKHRSTQELPSSTEVLIIGSGITGCANAHHLLDQPSPPSVLLLEARTAASGATGRNGGHTKHASYREFQGNVKGQNPEEAVKIARFEYKCMKAVHDFAKKHSIECDS